MANKRITVKRKPPDREPVLRETWPKVIEVLGRKGLVIGGKSMGGKIASLVADDAKVAGLVCLSYPFHPVGKPDKLRVEHLAKIVASVVAAADNRYDRTRRGHGDLLGESASIAITDRPAATYLHAAS